MESMVQHCPTTTCTSLIWRDGGQVKPLPLVAPLPTRPPSPLATARVVIPLCEGQVNRTASKINNEIVNFPQEHSKERRIFRKPIWLAPKVTSLLQHQSSTMSTHSEHKNKRHRSQFLNRIYPAHKSLLELN